MANCDDCLLYYLGAGAAVLIVWLVTLLILRTLQKRRKVSGTKDTTNGCELNPVTNAVKQESLVYHQIDFHNGNREKREKNEDEEVTYAQVKTTSNHTRRKKLDDALVGEDPQTTYAEIKHKAHKPKPESTKNKPHKPKPEPECSTVLYVEVIKKNTGNA